MGTTAKKSNITTGNNQNYTWGNLKSMRHEKTFYSVDEMIDAFQAGCDAGFANYINKARKQLKSNLQSSLDTMEVFFNNINNDEEKCKLMLLKVCGLDSFDFILALDRELYFNDDQSRPIYEDSFNIRRSNSNIGISFMPFTDNINFESLKSDNFIAVYGKFE